MYVLLAIVGLIATASAKDLTVGSEGGSLKFEQNVTASPTIWRQEKKVTFNVSDSEVITQVAIVDLREDKNGEAAIIEGGEGHKNVTIELKSPAVFRGFDFEIQVYAKQEDGAQIPVDSNQQTQDPFLQDTQVNDKQVPEKVADDVITGSAVTTTSTTPVPNGQDKVQHTIVIGQEDNQQVRPNREIHGQEAEQKTVIPIPGKDLQSDKNENKSDVDQNRQSKDSTYVNDLQKIVDDVFKNSSGVPKPAAEPKPTAEPTEDLDDFQFQIDINGDGQVQSSTAKSVEGQQTEKSVQNQVADGSQQAKKQVNVPLPYVKH